MKYSDIEEAWNYHYASEPSRCPACDQPSRAKYFLLCQECYDDNSMDDSSNSNLLDWINKQWNQELLANNPWIAND